MLTEFPLCAAKKKKNSKGDAVSVLLVLTVLCGAVAVDGSEHVGAAAARRTRRTLRRTSAHSASHTDQCRTGSVAPARTWRRQTMRQTNNESGKQRVGQTTSRPAPAALRRRNFFDLLLQPCCASTPRHNPISHLHTSFSAALCVAVLMLSRPAFRSVSGCAAFRSCSAGVLVHAGYSFELPFASGCSRSSTIVTMDKTRNNSPAGWCAARSPSPAQSRLLLC